MTEEIIKRPVTFLVAKWYGYAFAAMFVLYGGVKIILGVLDRDYTDFSQSFMFLVVGGILVAICMAFRELKSWGWYGLVVLNSLVVLAVLFNLGNALNIVFLLLSVGTLAALFAPTTKAQIFG